MEDSAAAATVLLKIKKKRRKVLFLQDCLASLCEYVSNANLPGNKKHYLQHTCTCYVKPVITDVVKGGLGLAALLYYTPLTGAWVQILVFWLFLCHLSFFLFLPLCLYLSVSPSYIYISLYSLTYCPWPQTSRRSSQGRTAPPSLSKALGVANHQFSVARRAVAVANPYCRRRPPAPSSRQPKSPRPRFPARGKVRWENQHFHTQHVLACFFFSFLFRKGVFLFNPKPAKMSRNSGKMITGSSFSINIKCQLI